MPQMDTWMDYSIRLLVSSDAQLKQQQIRRQPELCEMKDLCPSYTIEQMYAWP